MSDLDVLDLSATGLGERIASKELRSREAVEAYLDRIARLDSRLHAYFTVDAEGACAAAERADRELGSGRRRGPLHGVPVAVKDLCDTAGLRTSAGLRALWDRVPAEDAALVARLREAGAVLLGKLATTEGALGLHHPTIVPPVNPWNAERWTGVSSSGSAVATAAGLCAASIGSDTGGSIRVPSACQGLVGLKPTFGRVPLHGVFPLAPSLDHVGPMTRSVRDAAAMFDAIAGFDPRDATSSRAASPDTLSGLEAGVRGLRVGLDEAHLAARSEPAIAERVAAVAHVLRAQGATLHPVTVPPVEPVVAAWIVLAGAEAAAVYAERFPGDRSAFGPALVAFLDGGAGTRGPDVARAHAARLAFTGALAGVFESVDVLLCPALGCRVPAREPRWLEEKGFDVGWMLHYTAPFNLSGSPSLVVPAGFTDDDMPVGAQLVARPLEEGVLLRAGRAHEAATEGRARRPPLAL